MTNSVMDRKARERPERGDRRPYKLFEKLRPQPAIGDALVALGAVLIDELDHRTRELVALRVSAVRNSVYVWSAHWVLAHELALTCDEIARVTVGPTVFGGHDAAVLWAVDHVLANRPIDSAAQCELGEAVVRGVTAATKFYETVASIMQGAEPEDCVVPIAGIATPAEARGFYAVLTA
jgi:alkylhydroperoxidase family enzyme